MGTTSKQDGDFAAWVIPGSFLEDAIEWISKNMEPEDVFGLEKLSAWAEENGYVEEEG